MPRPSRPPLNVTPPTNMRFRRSRGRAYVPDVIQRVRIMVEGYAYSQSEIAKRCGIAQSTVDRWIKRHGWLRPAEAPLSTRLIKTARSGLGDRVVAAALRLAAVATDLATGLAERAAAEGAADGAADPEGEARARAVAAACRRLADNLGRLTEGPIPPMRNPPARRRDLPRRAALVEEARGLMEKTRLPQSEIARRLGLSKPTLIHWCQLGGWSRPIDAPARYGVPGASQGRSRRTELRSEGRYRLAEAERLIAALEGGSFEASLRGAPQDEGGAADRSTGIMLRRAEGPSRSTDPAEACEGALALLQGAIAIVQRRVKVGRGA